jgi:hypothetical protein
VKLSWILAGTLLLTPTVAVAQQAPILGTWKFDLKQGDKKPGPRTVIVRADSSASYGAETVRWRIIGDSLALALGGEWVNYRLKVKGKRRRARIRWPSPPTPTPSRPERRRG